MGTRCSSRPGATSLALLLQKRPTSGDVVALGDGQVGTKQHAFTLKVSGGRALLKRQLQRPAGHRNCRNAQRTRGRGRGQMHCCCKACCRAGCAASSRGNLRTAAAHVSSVAVLRLCTKHMSLCVYGAGRRDDSVQQVWLRRDRPGGAGAALWLALDALCTRKTPAAALYTRKAPATGSVNAQPTSCRCLYVQRMPRQWPTPMHVRLALFCLPPQGQMHILIREDDIMGIMPNSNATADGAMCCAAPRTLLAGVGSAAAAVATAQLQPLRTIT